MYKLGQLILVVLLAVGIVYYLRLPDTEQVVDNPFTCELTYVGYIPDSYHAGEVAVHVWFRVGDVYPHGFISYFPYLERWHVHRQKDGERVIYGEAPVLTPAEYAAACEAFISDSMPDYIGQG